MLSSGFLDNNMLILVGLVATHWGAFENDFDVALDIFDSASPGIAPEGWRRQGFKRRKTLFKEMTKTIFKDEENIAEFFSAICAEASEHYWKRNLVVHGRYLITFKKDGTPKIIATGFHNSREIVHEITEDQLGKLWHDLAYLREEMMSVFSRSEMLGHGLSSRERFLLQELWFDNHPQGPKRSKPLDQPQPSPE
jgi:hypothetical protein